MTKQPRMANFERILLRLEEAGEMLGLSRSAVHSLCMKHQLPVVRVGKALRIPVDDLLVWVQQQTKEWEQPTSTHEEE